jgi:NAD(P)H-hydrate epimerase
MGGAIALAARAAGRGGAGKVIALAPECNYTSVQMSVPEAMCRTSGVEHIEEIEEISGNYALGVGPGLAINEKTTMALTSLIQRETRPMVLDAGALGIISQKPALLKQVSRSSILTPHPLEFSRMFGTSTDTMAAADLARAMAMRYDLHIILKGHHSFIALSTGQCYYNTSGNPGLSTGGTGDVLTGLLTGLLASGYPPDEAALMGVWLHGTAADLATLHVGEESLVATDVERYIGEAWKMLRRQAE